MPKETDSMLSTWSVRSEYLETRKLLMCKKAYQATQRMTQTGTECYHPSRTITLLPVVMKFTATLAETFSLRKVDAKAAINHIC